MYPTSESDRLTPSPPEAPGCQQLLPAPRFQPFLPEQFPLPPGRFFGGDRGSALPLPPKEPPPHWYFPPQQPPAPGGLEFGAYEGSYGGGKFTYGVKAFPLPAPHPALPYYPEGPAGFGVPGGWSSGQFGSKGGTAALGWYREPREEKGKEVEGWAAPEPAGVLGSGDSSDSGLYECKRRRVSPYPSSTESSPPARNGDIYDKEPLTDGGYYGYYGN